MAVVIGIVSSLSTTAVLLFVLYFVRSWVLERLKASIKHEYDLKNMEIERQKEIRLKGEVVSEQLAHWVNSPSTLDYHQLNRLSFQAFIWLPKGLAEELSNTLSHQADAKDVREILINIRTHLQEADDGLKAKEVIVFKEPSIRQTFETSKVTSEARTKPKPRN